MRTSIYNVKTFVYRIHVGLRVTRRLDDTHTYARTQQLHVVQRIMLHLCNCRTWKSLLLIVCVQVCACVYLNIEKTVTFEIPKQEPEEEHMVFATIGIDGDGPRYPDECSHVSTLTYPFNPTGI